MATAATLSLLRFSPLSPPRLVVNPRLSRPAFTIQLGRRPSTSPSRLNAARMSATIPASDRLVSALSYALPFLNSLHYGRFLFSRFPPLASAIAPVLPLVSAYRSVPYASFVAFFALYLGVVRNPAFSHYVRFNSMQAVVLDVLLALPTLAQRIFGPPPARGVGFRILEVAYGAMFAFALGCFLYGVAASVLGRTPYLPIVAAAADRQI